MPEFDDSKKEKMRLCPTCRMEISVLATKCRFCGESVGRPRDESRALSIDDLGGETIRHYAPSSSVMEAMEAFRAETEISSNPPADALPEKKSVFGIGGKKAPAPKAPTMSDGLPQLDARSQVLAELAIPKAPTAPIRRQKQNPEWMKKVGVFAGLVAAMVILYFGVVQVSAMINRKQPIAPPQFTNRAKAMLESGADPIDTLEAAAMALKKEEHPDNEQIMSQARHKFADAVNALLFKKPWKEDYLNDASRMVNKAFKTDSNEDIRGLKEEVDKEIFAYGMVLLDSKDGGPASVQINNQARSITQENSSAKDIVHVNKGDTILDRFKVTEVKSGLIRVEDTVRNNRSLTFMKGSAEVTSP